ncbi:MAG: YafY family transcriptional regulator [Chitinophagaceae bacterium]|nr:YafY family transcriptional regulator [Chitinophagaceae bacterium]
MNRIDRLMGILTMLQSKKFLPAERIAEKFSISIRTVYRDIKALTEIGVPVSFENGRGYFIVQGYFLPPVSFTNEEANALLLMESIAGRFGDHSIKKHYETALNKVKAVLRGSQKDKLEQLQPQIKAVSCGYIQNNFAYLTQLQEAIASQNCIEIEYQNTKSEISIRILEPIGLIFYALNWHLIAWCHWRNDYRDFRVSRILKLSSPGKAFSKTDHIDLNDYMKLLPVNY